MKRRAWQAVGVLAGVTAIAVGSYFVGSHTQSGQEAAAHAGSVQRTQLTEPVTGRVLSTSAVFRVDYKDGAVSQIATAPDPPSGADPIVTSVNVAAGESVKAGRAMIAVADQPVFALPGSLPMYRDIQRGDSGPDVTQLQRALATLGYYAGDPTNAYSATTASAVSALWRDAGFSAPTAASGEPFTAPTSGGSSGARPAGGSALAMVPKGSIAYFRSLPVTIAKVETGRGGLLRSGDNWASIRTGQPVLTTQIPVAGDTRIRTGTAVTLTDDATLITGRGVVARVGTTTSARDGSGQVIPATITIAGRNPFTVGSNLRGNITLKSTNRVVLSVPTVAIRSASDGSLYVIRIERGSRTTVTVATGLSANGYTQIASATPALTAGQSIAVN